ncbi:MAG: hypothetical protein LBR58_10765 [Propionibacteriaceae bacterium]|jgi:hypothetical protein|nr:hypothetical protein [Propionibacteriaceae bacterium]
MLTWETTPELSCAERSAFGLDLGFADVAAAEDWLGSSWAELAEAGVTAVTLVDGGEAVMGPMSLDA